MKKLTSFVLIATLMVFCLGSTASASTTPKNCKCFFETVTNVQPEATTCTRHATKYVFNSHAVRKACDGMALDAIIESFVVLCNALSVAQVSDKENYTHIEMTFKTRTMGVLYGRNEVIIIERN